MIRAPTDVVQFWLIEQFPDLDVSPPQTDPVYVTMFELSNDRVGSLYQLAISDGFFTSYQTIREIREQLKTRGVADDLRAHPRQWRLLLRVGALRSWTPSL